MPTSTSAYCPVDCNGERTTADSLDILRIAGELPPHGACPANADYDGNGQVQAADAVSLLSDIAGG